jgi:hypothetical protein
MSLIVNFNFIYCSNVDILRKNNRLSSSYYGVTFLAANLGTSINWTKPVFLHSTLKSQNGLIFLFYVDPRF